MYHQLKKDILTSRFSRMNESQLEAVFHTLGPLLILAGAGSGKTTVLINRILNLVKYGNAYHSETVPEHLTPEDLKYMQDYLDQKHDDINKINSLIACYPVKPWSILAITFTNKAANELKQRLINALGEEANDVRASTFHSACVEILRRGIDKLGYNRSFTIYDTDDSIRVIKDQLKALNIDDKIFQPRGVLAAISSAKDKMQTPELFEKLAGNDYRLSSIAKIYRNYQTALKRANAVDFDDIIMLTVQLLSSFPDVLEHYQNRYKFIMVDEYQDTSHSQYMLVSMLAQKHQNICVVGDDDQSIYKFRGATIENILNFEKQFLNARSIRLEQNYRSTSTILDAANAVISNNSSRKGKTLWTENGQGANVTVCRNTDETGESNFVADTILDLVNNGGKFSDCAVLYRMNAQSSNLERAMIASAIPYRIVGGLRFYERKEIKDIISYLSVINNPMDEVRLARIINEPKRGIGDSTIASAREISASLGTSLFDVVSEPEQYIALSKKAAALREFTGMIKDLQKKALEMPLDELFDTLLSATGYSKYLELLGNEGRVRIENVEELKSNILRYIEENDEPTLSAFLEEVALYTDLVQLNESEDKVVMMTMHSAKGLEFDNVFIVGMEENLFPSHQSIYNTAEIEEERRLAYVGITRAKKRIYLCAASQRMIFGYTSSNMISRFVTEIPKNLCDISDNSSYSYRRGPSLTADPKAGAKNSRAIGISAKTAPTSQRQPANELSVGNRVNHKVFGDGLVLSITAMGNDSLVEIAFDTVGTKKIMQNFAKLTKI